MATTPKTTNNEREQNDNESKNAPSCYEVNKVAATASSMKKIEEGSCEMIYSTDHEGCVFYNPVQVQNRDLSTLMIALFIERHALRVHHLGNRKFEQKAKNRQENQAKTKPGQHHKNEVIIGSCTNQQHELDGNKEKEPSTMLSGKQALEELLTQGDKNGNVLRISILDALAASGLRSMRYWKEIPGVHHITINDMEGAAVDRAHQNILHNGLQHVLTTSRHSFGIRINHADALHEMYNSRPAIGNKTGTTKCTSFAPYHVIDLDPYGSAAPFLDAAIQALDHHHGDGSINNKNGRKLPAFLCVTCTDMAALGGSHPETAFGRYYGAMPIPRAGYLQEMAIRILLYSIAMTAAKYGKKIKPILSVGMDFYIRVFVEVQPDKAEINALSIDKIGYVYQSTQCPSYYIVPAGKLGGSKGTSYQPGRMPTVDFPRNQNEHNDCNQNDGNSQQQMQQQHIGFCQETGATFKIGGPIWIGPMHDLDVIREAISRINDVKNKIMDKIPLDNNVALSSQPNDVMKYITTSDRILGLLLSCQEELVDVPLFYRLPDLSQILHVSTPPMTKFRSALQNAGYKVSGYHKNPQAIKTNAPNVVIWDIMKAWVKENPPKKPIPPNSLASKILAFPPVTLKNVDFTIHLSSSTQQHKNQHVARFPMNPQRNWGPKPAAKGYQSKNIDKINCMNTSRNDQKRKMQHRDQKLVAPDDVSKDSGTSKKRPYNEKG